MKTQRKVLTDKLLEYIKDSTDLDLDTWRDKLVKEEGANWKLYVTGSSQSGTPFEGYIYITGCDELLDEIPTVEKEVGLGPLLSKEFGKELAVEEGETEIPELNTVADIMSWMRDSSWDLWSALDWLAEHNFCEQDSTENGSCQNIYHRRAAQLVQNFGVPVESFYDWDT